MKKYKYLLVLAAISAALLTGCKEGVYQDRIPEGVSVGRFSPFRVGLKTPISVNLKSPMHHVCY